MLPAPMVKIGSHWKFLDSSTRAAGNNFSFIPDTSCKTVQRNKCKFPYRMEDGHLRYECFKKKTTSRIDPVQFKSYCPTKVNPDTRVMDENSVEECLSYSCPLAKYHSHSELMMDINELTDFSSDFSNNAVLFDLGNSQRGDPLYGIRLMEGVGNFNEETLVS